MKNAKIIIVSMLVFFIGTAVYGQKTDHSKASTEKTATIKVWGNCDMCKARIEKAAKVDGVSKAVWDEKTKDLTLVYNPAKVSSDDVQKKIAAVGHDTEKYYADSKAYNSLPACCKYERRK